MSDALYEDNLTQETETSPIDHIIAELEALKSRQSDGVIVEDYDVETLSQLNQCEAQIFLAGLRTAEDVNEVCGDYLNSPDYSDWPTFWATQADRAERIAQVYEASAIAIPDANEFAMHRYFMFALARDWREGRGRSTSESELIWYFLPRNVSRVDLRSSPKVEEGAESYIDSERKGGGDPSFSLRIVEPTQSQIEFEMLKAVIPDLIGARDILNKYSYVDFEKHTVLVRSGLHGRFVAATGHQYKRKNEGLFRIISNWNIKDRNRQRFYPIMPERFSPQILSEMMNTVASESVLSLAGHELVEFLIEDKYEDQIESIGNRAIVELYADLATLKAGFQLGEATYSEMVKGYIAGCVRLSTLDQNDRKLIRYMLGSNLVMKRLKEAGAIQYDGDGRLADIDQLAFTEVVSKLEREAFGIIESGSKSANDQLFELTPQA